MTRRAVTALVVVGVLAVTVALVAVGVNRLNAKDDAPGQRTLRTRIDAIEQDGFVNALLTAPHSTQSVQESLECQPARAGYWNVRAVASGDLDADRVTALLAQPQAFGWTDAGPDIFAKTIQPGVVVKLAAVLDDDALTLTANLSSGLACQAR